MDPEANVLEQWEIVESFERTPALKRTTQGRAKRERLVELRIALRDWRSSGGFAPSTPPPDGRRIDRTCR